MCAHRLSWIMANGPIQDGLWILHHCDNPPCVNPDHLFLGNRSDNLTDCARKGRVAGVKLSFDDAVEIRRKYSKGNITQKMLSKEYGICSPLISMIVTHKRLKEWKPIKDR